MYAIQVSFTTGFATERRVVTTKSEAKRAQLMSNSLEGTRTFYVPPVLFLFRHCIYIFKVYDKPTENKEAADMTAVQQETEKR